MEDNLDMNEIEEELIFSDEKVIIPRTKFILEKDDIVVF